MANPMLSRYRHLLGTSTVRRMNYARFVSTSSNNKLATGTIWNQGRPGERPSDRATDSISKSKHFATAAAAADPLQHILDHPSASIILRDACKCTRCKDHSTSQRDFNLAHIPTDLKPAAVDQDARGNWAIRWQNDMPGWEDHVSMFTPHEIERLQVYMQNEHNMPTRLWSRAEYARDQLRIPFEEYMHSDAGLAKALYYFAQHGLVMIENVPEDPQLVVSLANRIAAMKSTFYGETWDIKSVPNATNVAFTNKYLGFHGDLIYLKEPPTVQFLHCIHNSCTGGESRFVDNFKALDTLYAEDPDAAEVLSQTRLRYEYENDGYYYTDIKPIVQWRTDSYQFPRRRIRGAISPQMQDVYRIFWAPQFLGSIISDWDVATATNRRGGGQPDLKHRVAAMKKYADILERPDLVYEEKMIPGTCVMFDNLRVLHARNEFDINTGRRWLRGTYVDGQDLWNVEMRLKDHLAKLDGEAARI